MNFVPQNELEAALVAAFADPGARLHFYEILSKSDLIVVTHDTSEAREPALGPLLINGVLSILAFSPPTRIDELRSELIRQWDLQQPTSALTFTSINAKTLFTRAGSHPVLLNLGSEAGKKFSPAEMASVVDGSIFAPPPEVVNQETHQVLLGQPNVYPTHVTEPLAAFFKTRKEVEAAYLAHWFDPHSGEDARTMIGVDAASDADFKHLMAGAAMVLEGVAKGQRIRVDFLRIEPDSDISRYMIEETKPFYRKETKSLHRKKFLGLF